MEIKLLSNNKNNMGFTAKIVLIGFLVLILLIPLELVKSVIREREYTGNEARKEMEDLWGGQQTLSGPILNIPYTGHKIVGREKEAYKEIAHFMPEDLDINVELKPQQRKRGIFSSVVYVAEAHLKGNFPAPDLSSYSPDVIHWDEAYLTLGVSENRGFQNNVFIQLNDSMFSPEPGLPEYEVIRSGITVLLGNSANSSQKFDIQFQLNGSNLFEVIPLGKTTQVKMTSTWEDPSFMGSFLPANSEINEEGFTANWLVTHLNRDFPQQWSGKQYKISDAAFGVKLYLAADHYQKSQRSAKYGILFIALTFLVFIFAEITTKTRIHIFNYLLVSVALILFFSMLTALSEQVGFNAAYGISGLAIILLISLFTRSITGALNMAIRVLLVLSGLYTFMFFLLQMKEYAFLAGNIGLFIILAIIMWFAGKLKPEPNIEEQELKPE